MHRTLLDPAYSIFAVHRNLSHANGRIKKVIVAQKCVTQKRVIRSAPSGYAADSRRGFKAKSSIGTRIGMRITDEKRPWPPSLIHTLSATEPITERSRLWLSTADQDRKG